jgi:3-methyladenine DNA glycosylase AlkD
MAHPYITHIKKEFAACANAAKAAGAKAYLLHQFEFYGIQTPERRKICKNFYKNNSVTSHATLVTIIKEAFAAPERELHYFAIELLAYHHKLWTPKTITIIEWMLTHKSWWDSVDSTNSNVIGKYFIQFPSLLESTTNKWNQSNNFWLQRMSILFQLQYKEKTNTALLEKYIVNCLGSNEFFINKAIGWALRAYAYTHKKWVIRFVKDHPQLSNLSKREALKHM